MAFNQLPDSDACNKRQKVPAMRGLALVWVSGSTTFGRAGGSRRQSGHRATDAAYYYYVIV